MRWVIGLTVATKTLWQKKIDDTGKGSTNLLPNPNRPPPIKIESSASKKKERLRAPKFRQFFIISSSSSSTLFFFFLFSLKRKLSAVYITHR